MWEVPSSTRRKNPYSSRTYRIRGKNSIQTNPSQLTLIFLATSSPFTTLSPNPLSHQLFTNGRILCWKGINICWSSPFLWKLPCSILIDSVWFSPVNLVYVRFSLQLHKRPREGRGELFLPYIPYWSFFFLLFSNSLWLKISHMTPIDPLQPAPAPHFVCIHGLCI